MKEYCKILVARYNKRNDCHVNDGIALYPETLKIKQIKSSISHRFTSVADHKTTSKFGWVKEVSPFSLDNFIEKYFKDKKISEEDIGSIQIMLDSIDKLSEECPVGVDYFCRGIEKQEMTLSVHRVFFYYPNKN